MDPILGNRATEQYLFARGNPLSYVDRLGLWPDWLDKLRAKAGEVIVDSINTAKGALDEAVNVAGTFAANTIESFGINQLHPLVDVANGMLTVNETVTGKRTGRITLEKHRIEGEYSTSAHAGRIAGDVISLIYDATLVIGGLTETGGGAAATTVGAPAVALASGPAAPVTGPATAAAGAGITLHGALTAAYGAYGFLRTMYNMYNDVKAAQRGSGGVPGGAEGIKQPKAPRNAHLAGKKHPKTDVPFDENGYPDFKAAGVVKSEVKITPTGSRAGDYRAANQAAGLDKTPEGYTWHHHQDGTTMQLVPRKIHAETGHTGGFSQSE